LKKNELLEVRLDDVKERLEYSQDQKGKLESRLSEANRDYDALRLENKCIRQRGLI
jgi:hypothetical protein